MDTKTHAPRMPQTVEIFNRTAARTTSGTNKCSYVLTSHSCNLETITLANATLKVSTVGWAVYGWGGGLVVVIIIITMIIIM